MLRRWLIRSIFVAIWLICAGAWAMSHWFMLGVEYSPGSDCVELDMIGGCVEFARVPSPKFFGVTLPAAPRWVWICQPAEVAVFQSNLRAYKYSLVGFAFEEFGSGFVAVIPLWFLTFLSAVLLWFAWRKTRPKLKGKAFPIEPNANAN